MLPGTWILNFKIITGIIITTSDGSFGIGTLLNLAADRFEGSPDTVLLQKEAVLAKVAVKLMVDRFCLA